MKALIVAACNIVLLLGSAAACSASPAQLQLPANRWVEVRKDQQGARRGSAIRYVPDAGSFFLWGFMNADPDFLQEHPLMEVPEYDMVMFDAAVGRWQNHLPKAWESVWTEKLPLAYVPRTYSGITSGSERTVLRSPADHPGAAPRPDLNIVFDQVAYHPPSRSLIYFTGGLTAAYDVAERRWRDLRPEHNPPPVLGGSLAYDAVNDEIVLFGGGHVAEKGPDERLIGYTGTWIYSFRDGDWRRLESEQQPPPRMNTRLVHDAKNNVLVVFGGDGQSHYLADTWLYDLRTRRWRRSQAPGGPPPRAGHFTVFDPATGWVIIGGGYNRRDLTDMWAYDAAQDRWRRLVGQVPTGFYTSADIDPERRLILLTTNTRKPGDTMTCNVLFPVRTTYGFRIDGDSLLAADQQVEAQPVMPKRPPEKAAQRTAAEPARRRAQAKRLQALPVNRWVLLANPGRIAPSRTWGSATLDADRGRILYWGGGHCGYGGSDVDAYDIDAHTWVAGNPAPEYPDRAWNLGVRLAGVTFEGKPWTTHGRRIYAYDPVSRRMIMVRPIRLTTGYEPELLRNVSESRRPRAAALVNPPSSYVKYTTWSYDHDTKAWEFLGGAPVGFDTLVSTPRGVMGVNVDWPATLNDSGYGLPWRPSDPPEDHGVWAFQAGQRKWQRLGEPQPSPQNLYEMTSLAYDSKSDQLILHGGGAKRDELWTFDLASQRWQRKEALVVAPKGAPPACAREAVYLPREDVFLTYGRAPGSRTEPAMWAYTVGENGWRRVDIIPGDEVAPAVAASQNRALVYDEQRDLVLLVLGTRGDTGQAHVFALRYRHGEAPFVAETR